MTAPLPSIKTLLLPWSISIPAPAEVSLAGPVIGTPARFRMIFFARIVRHAVVPEVVSALAPTVKSPEFLIRQPQLEIIAAQAGSWAAARPGVIAIASVIANRLNAIT